MNRYPTEAADGTPHLSYFAGDTSFVWSGSAERPVQVCPGGYGEPVRDTFWLGLRPGGLDRGWRVPLHIMLDEFRRACEQYLHERSET
jgi:hypothetical protein